MCRVQVPRGFPPHARRSFFERVHGLSILLVGLGPSAHMLPSERKMSRPQSLTAVAPAQHYVALFLCHRGPDGLSRRLLVLVFYPSRRESLESQLLSGLV